MPVGEFTSCSTVPWDLKLLAANQTLSEADFPSLSTGGLLASLVTSENQWIRRYLRFIPTCGLGPPGSSWSATSVNSTAGPAMQTENSPFPFSLLPFCLPRTLSLIHRISYFFLPFTLLYHFMIIRLIIHRLHLPGERRLR